MKSGYDEYMKRVISLYNFVQEAFGGTSNFWEISQAYTRETPNKLSPMLGVMNGWNGHNPFCVILEDLGRINKETSRCRIIKMEIDRRPPSCFPHLEGMIESEEHKVYRETSRRSLYPEFEGKEIITDSTELYVFDKNAEGRYVVPWGHFLGVFIAEAI